MSLRVVAIFFALTVTGFAQNSSSAFVTVDDTLLQVAPDGQMKVIARSTPNASDLVHGSTNPRLSPDKRWIAFVRERNIQLQNMQLQSVAAAKLIPVTLAGRPEKSPSTSVETFILGFTPDSQQLIYSIAPGAPSCHDDCPGAVPKPPQGDYGFFSYAISTGTSTKLPIPPSTRIHGVANANSLLATKVGDYGDVVGLLEWTTQKFTPLPKACSSATNCTLSDSGTRASCVQTRGGGSQIIECMQASEASPASPPGTCPMEFEMPLRSPAGAHIAYLQRTNNCSGKRQSLWIDQEPRFECESLSALGWVDEERIAVRCKNEFVLLTREGKKVSSLKPQQGSKSAGRVY